MYLYSSRCQFVRFTSKSYGFSVFLLSYGFFKKIFKKKKKLNFVCSRAISMMKVSKWHLFP